VGCSRPDPQTPSPPSRGLKAPFAAVKSEHRTHSVSLFTTGPEPGLVASFRLAMKANHRRSGALGRRLAAAG
jgi:hypothetical protein